MTASSLSACSLSNLDERALPQNLFGKIASRQFEDAEALVTQQVGMSVISTKNSQLFVGKKDVIGELSNIINVGRFKMVGDNPEYAPGGLAWRSVGPWQCCDMAKDGKFVLDNVGCGTSEGELSQPIFNVFVLPDYSSDTHMVSRILLLENTLSVFQIYSGSAF